MPALMDAAQDLRFLLGRGYPRQRCLELVGDRHALDADQRHLLRRGVFAPELAASRRQRLLPPAAIAGQTVALDGHNQLITLETALKGGVLLLADDGVVRDISGRGRSYTPGPHTRAAAGLLLAALAPAARVLIFLDAPLSRSGELAANLRQMLEQAGRPGDAQAVPVPERQLLAHPGPVASSDSALLDRVPQPLDLAGAIILAMQPSVILERLS
jgi:hypothetical protein